MLEPNASSARIVAPVRTSKMKAHKNMTRRTILDLYMNDIVYRDLRERRKGHENLQSIVMDYLSEVG